jgi:flagellar assembly factor FliW
MGEETIRFTHVRFGEQEVSPDKVIEFPEGLPGFERFKSYALFSDPESEPFQWLLSIQNDRLGFVVINPVMLWSDYNPKISKEDLRSLDITGPDDVLLLSIVTLSDDPQNVTANLSGPILINAAARRGRQLALLDDRYTTKHSIVEALSV